MGGDCPCWRAAPHSGMGRRPVQELCMAVHCMCCPLTWLTPLGCSANVLMPSHSSHRIETLHRLANNWPQQAAVCSTEQTNKTLKPYDQRRTSANRPPLGFPSDPHAPLPTSSRMTVFTQNPARFYPYNCDFSNEPLPRARPKTRMLERSRSSTLPAPLGWQVLPRCSAAPPFSLCPLSECRVPGNWYRTNLEALQLAS